MRETEFLKKQIRNTWDKIRKFESRYGTPFRDSLYGHADDMELLEWEGEIETLRRLEKKLIRSCFIILSPFHHDGAESRNFLCEYHIRWLPFLMNPSVLEKQPLEFVEREADGFAVCLWLCGSGKNPFHPLIRCHFLEPPRNTQNTRSGKWV